MYIDRLLTCKDRLINENQLLESSERAVVVLGEPGAGKSRLLQSLADKLNVKKHKANIIFHSSVKNEDDFLIIDALDEVARYEKLGIDKVVIDALRGQEKKVILSCRSSEWEDSKNRLIAELIDSEPLVLRLKPFEEKEQEKLFGYYAEGVDFNSFMAELKKVGLDGLVVNPQFLELLALAYKSNGEHFSDKRGAFEDAVLSLAKERNPDIPLKGRTGSAEKLECAGRVFSILLLSGAEGVSLGETDNKESYPAISQLVVDEELGYEIIDSKLFVLGDDINTHEPIHRIVAEYCAAKYIVGRVNDQKDPLSFEEVLTILAPNQIVRDDLRGLLGWISTLGDQTVQELAIDVDPYAMLANGDSSLLLPSSKKRLIDKLSELSDKDPLFRRSDLWRSFNLSGFFDPIIEDQLRYILKNKNGDGHLLGLILELLQSDSATNNLKEELIDIVINNKNEEYIRILALRALLADKTYDFSPVFNGLVDEGTGSSLSVAAEILKTNNIGRFSLDLVADFFDACALLYPNNEYSVGSEIRSTYFIRMVINEIEGDKISSLLSNISERMKCVCQEEKYYLCTCFNQRSKVLGLLLDKLVKSGCYEKNAELTWRWLEKARYQYPIDGEASASVGFLQKNDTFRREIQWVAFRDLHDREAIRDLISGISFGSKHSGLKFKDGDFEYLLTKSFESLNVTLWRVFLLRHNYDKDNYFLCRSIRKIAKQQARRNADFMRAWALDERSWNKRFRYLEINQKRKIRRSSLRNKALRERRFDNVREQFFERKAAVDAGEDVGFLEFFSSRYLAGETGHYEVFEKEYVDSVLCKCLEFIIPHTPSAKKAANLHIANKYNVYHKIFLASVVALWLRDGHLPDLSRENLKLLRFCVDDSHSPLGEEGYNKFIGDINSKLFLSDDDKVNFLSELIEPQLSSPVCTVPLTHWLINKDEFASVASHISIDWLDKYYNVSLRLLTPIFEAAVKYADKGELESLILKVSRDVLCDWRDNPDKDVVDFWLIRYFYFIEDINLGIIDWLGSNPENVLILESFSGRFVFNDYGGKWPDLSALKIYQVMDVFCEAWPKVYLPSHWGTGDPDSEKAYRFLKDLVCSGQLIPDSDLGFSSATAGAIPPL